MGQVQIDACLAVSRYRWAVGCGPTEPSLERAANSWSKVHSGLILLHPCCWLARLVICHQFQLLNGWTLYSPARRCSSAPAAPACCFGGRWHPASCSSCTRTELPLSSAKPCQALPSPANCLPPCPPAKAQAHKAVPLQEVDGRRRVARLDAHLQKGGGAAAGQSDAGQPDSALFASSAG